ncbi:WYL domain-containing protein (plasmid) [Dermacoccus abyssi]|uniref:WYL domain-containing protein n=1 Tax=Dermacoccus abyssi TaxID=322596 RepID=A0ABX5ZFX2_9MICO|nr:WYL domain-containing protein [Dermacoccus abyssi]
MWAGRWYLVARDRNHATWGTYRVDRIRPKNPAGRPFTPRPSRPRGPEPACRPEPRPGRHPRPVAVRRHRDARAARGRRRPLGPRRVRCRTH